MHMSGRINYHSGQQIYTFCIFGARDFNKALISPCGWSVGVEEGERWVVGEERKVEGDNEWEEEMWERRVDRDSKTLNVEGESLSHSLSLHPPPFPSLFIPSSLTQSPSLP